MSARYWIAKYVDDAFRNETKNLGVIVFLDGNVAAKFVGEREDHVLDLRRIRGAVKYSSVYNQWRDYWRLMIDRGKYDEIIKAVTPNFYVVEGGFVSDIGQDTASDVCDYLYSMLVSSGGMAEAYQWDVPEEFEQAFSSEIIDEFNARALLADHDLMIRHPILREQPVQGVHAVHVPSFIQRNGLLSVFEYIDLGRKQQKTLRERAGWMGYMFVDIKNREHGTVAYSIIRPEKGEPSGAVEYAREVLSTESEVVNWANDNEKDRFLRERRVVADAI